MRVAIQVNDRKLIIRDWAYHLENRMREAYGVARAVVHLPVLHPAILPARPSASPAPRFDEAASHHVHWADR